MKNSVSVSYKTINLAVALVWVASIGAMEPKDDTLVTSKDFRDLSASIMRAEGKEEPSLNNSGGWFSSFTFKDFSDWWHGLDTNVVAELQQDTLTKEVVAQDGKLQQRAHDAIDIAIAKKRTENLCDLLKQLNKFDMLVLDKRQRESITQFLNEKILVACQQKAPTKLIEIINTMKTAEISIKSDSLTVINAVMNEQKESAVQIFNHKLISTQVAVLKLKEQMEKDREEYKGPLKDAQEIVLLQEYLNGGVEVLSGLTEKSRAIQTKRELGIYLTSKANDTLYSALKTFAEKSFEDKK